MLEQDVEKVLISEEELKRRITEMGRQITQEYHGEPLTIVGILKGASIFFADLTVRHPTTDNAELLWHCGNFAPSLARDPENCNLSTVTLGNGKCVPSESQWEIRHGDITLCRFDGDHGEYQLLMGEGRGVDGPETIGTYCWFEADNWAKWEHKLVTGPYIHHVAGVHGKFAPVLFEACKYLGIKADPAEPGAEALEAYWQGWGGC